MARGGRSQRYSGYLETLGGVPTMPSGLPLTIPHPNGTTYTNGRYYFVDENDGNDGDDGLAPDRALATIEQGITLMNANVNWSSSSWGCKDVLVIAPGVYEETLTALPYGGQMIGLGVLDKSGDHGVVIKSAAPVDVTSALNTRISNITFESTGAGEAFECDTSNYMSFDHCDFRGVKATTVSAFTVKVAGLLTTWRDCFFSNAITGFRVGAGSATGFFECLIEDSRIMYVGTYGIQIEDNLPTAGTLVNRVHIGDGATTLTEGIHSPGAKLNVSNTTVTATAMDPASAAGQAYYNNVYLNGAIIT